LRKGERIRARALSSHRASPCCILPGRWLPRAGGVAVSMTMLAGSRRRRAEQAEAEGGRGGRDVGTSPVGPRRRRMSRSITDPGAHPGRNSPPPLGPAIAAGILLREVVTSLLDLELDDLSEPDLGRGDGGCRRPDLHRGGALPIAGHNNRQLRRHSRPGRERPQQ
jgi:hypothetical protein